MALEYRIGNIGWHNFERLVQALLKKVIGAGVTSFGGSKDDGRDATFVGTAPYPSESDRWTGAWVFQVKYVDLEDQGGNAARSALKSTFKKELETIRLKRAKINNYLLITDVPLTAGARDELRELATTSAVSDNFAVVDGKEVCEWMNIHPELRRSFPQLLGLADLNQIVHSNIYARSKAYFEQWAPRLSVFVQTDAYTKALQVMREHRFVVLDGPPEVGKSMMAAALAVLYASEGFQIYDVRSPEQLFSVLDPDAQQLFIADDAIGSIDLDAGKTDAWARDLAGVIPALNKNHLLIWTARHYILAEALATSRLGDALDEFPGQHEVLVEVGDMREVEKAEMLYNHAKQARLAQNIRKALKETARRLIRHANFTPERVRQLVEYLRSNFSGQERLKSEILHFLDNPGARWTKAFRLLPKAEQVLLTSLLDLDEPANLTELHQAYERRVNGVASLPFSDAVTRLKHSFITVTRTYQGLEVINFKHPSLRDVLLGELRTDLNARRRYIELTSPLGLANLIRGIANRRDA